MNHPPTFNRGCRCPTTISVAANSSKVAVARDDVPAFVSHLDPFDGGKSNHKPSLSNLLAIRPRRRRARDDDAGKKGPPPPSDVYGRAFVPSSSNPHANDVDAAGARRAPEKKKSQKKLLLPRSLSFPSKLIGAAVVREAQPTTSSTTSSTAFAAPPHQWPSAPSMARGGSDALGGPPAAADRRPPRQRPGLERAAHGRCPDGGADLEGQLRAYAHASSSSDASRRYRTGQMLRRSSHAFPFASSAHAHAVLTRLPLDAPLFANRGGEWTYGLVAGRFEDSGGDTCVIVSLGGNAREIVKRKDWRTRLTLVHWEAVRASSPLPSSPLPSSPRSAAEDERRRRSRANGGGGVVATAAAAGPPPLPPSALLAAQCGRPGPAKSVSFV